MSQSVRARGRIVGFDVKQSIDEEGDHHQEASVKFLHYKRAPAQPNRPNYAVNRPRQPNGIRYNVGGQRDEAGADAKQNEA